MHPWGYGKVQHSIPLNNVSNSDSSVNLPLCISSCFSLYVHAQLYLLADCLQCFTLRLNHNRQMLYVDTDSFSFSTQAHHASRWWKCQLHHYGLCAVWTTTMWLLGQRITSIVVKPLTGWDQPCPYFRGWECIVHPTIGKLIICQCKDVLFSSEVPLCTVLLPVVECII